MDPRLAAADYAATSILWPAVANECKGSSPIVISAHFVMWVMACKPWVMACKPWMMACKPLKAAAGKPWVMANN